MSGIVPANRPCAAVRHALVVQAIVFVALAMLFAVLPFAGGLRHGPAMVVDGTAVLLALFFFVVSFTFLAEWLCRVLDATAGRAWLKAAFIAAASCLLVPGVGFSLWLDFATFDVQDLFVPLSLGLVVSGAVVHLAKALAVRLRDHREWATLPLTSTD